MDWTASLRSNKEDRKIDEKTVELYIEKRSHTLSKKWPLSPSDSPKRALKAIYTFCYRGMKTAANISATDVSTKIITGMFR
jgi:hypothetical protein